jgi:hypothetical protein
MGVKRDEKQGEALMTARVVVEAVLGMQKKSILGGSAGEEGTGGLPEEAIRLVPNRSRHALFMDF